MSEPLSPKQLARAIGSSESTVKRWIDKGIVEAIVTAGGHRKVAVDVALRFIREQGHDLIDPALLGLPTINPSTLSALDRTQEHLIEMLTEGNEPAARRLVIDLYMGGFSAARIFDEVLAPAFCEIGKRWECGKVEVYMERRACEACVRLLHHLHELLPHTRQSAPRALGCTLDGDPYTLSSCMAELSLRDIGWNSQSLGNMLPFETVRRAITREAPRLLWLSVSSVHSEDRFVVELNRLVDEAVAAGTAVVVGGRGLVPTLREKLRFSSYCDTFQQLTTFAKSLSNLQR